MQVKQITSEMQQFLPTASGAAGLQRNSGWLCNARGFFFLDTSAKSPAVPVGAAGSHQEQNTLPRSFLPTFHRCYLNVRAESSSPICTQRAAKPAPAAGSALHPRAAGSDLIAWGVSAAGTPRLLLHWVPALPIPALGPRLCKARV